MGNPKTLPAVKDDLFLFNGRQVSNINTQVIIEFSDKVNEAILRQALVLSIKSELILSYKFETPFAQRPRWKLDKNIETDNLFQFSQANDQENAELKKKLFLSENLHPTNDNVIKVCLVRYVSDTLIIKFNHIAADAGAMKEYAIRLSKTYSALLEDPNYIPPRIDGDRSLKQIYAQISFADKLRIPFYSARVLLARIFPRKNWMLPLKKGNTGQQKFISCSLNGEESKLIKTYCSENKVSVNDVITALYFRALHKTINPSPNVPMRILSTINIRRYLPSGIGEALCNLSSVLVINIGRDLGKDLKETIKKVNEAIQWQKDSYLGLNSHRTDVLNVRLLPYFLVSTLNTISAIFSFLLIESGKIPPLFTNIGVLDDKELIFFGSEVKNVYWYAPVSYHPVSYLCASGFKQNITLSTAFCEDVISAETMQSLLDSAKAELIGLQNKEA